MAGRVEGKVAFITGAARGQGRSHALRLAEEGADIIAVDLCGPIESVETYPLSTEEDLQETVEQVEGLDRRIVARKADVRDIDALGAALQAGVDELGRVDIVVANAGIATFHGQGWEIPAQAWQEMIDINLTGVWHTAKVAIPHMIEAGNGGSLIFISSTAGLKGFETVAHYTAAKHAVVGLMRALAKELAPHWIRVNTIHPTNVDTLMIQNEGTYGMFLPDDPEPTQEKAIPAFTMMHQLDLPWIDAVDISNAVLYLSSDEGRYLTGVTLPVDAGVMLK